MLLALSAPVLTYAASILKVYYNAATGDISGIIYSDNKDISLSLVQGEGEYQIPSTVVGEVYHSDSANVYWANVEGKIALGLKPNNANVVAGDTRNFAASVSDDVYRFENSFTAPVVPSNYGYGYGFNNNTTHISLGWRPVTDFGLSYYNFYSNGIKIGETKRDNFSVYGLHYHSLQDFAVSAVDLLGHESTRSTYNAMHTHGLVTEGKVLFSGKSRGAAFQPNEALVTIRPYTEHLNTSMGISIQLIVPPALAYDHSYVSYKVNKSELDANDFELIDDSGRITPADWVTFKGETFKFYFAGQLSTEKKYTLRLSSSASGAEIFAPNTNTKQARIYLYLKSNAEQGDYSFDYFSEDIVFGTFPAKPTGLNAVAGDGILNLTWNSNTEADLAGYLVWLDGKLLTESPIKKTSFFIDGLQNGKTYHVNVAAVNKSEGRSYQAYIFPIPQAPAQNGGSTEGSGSGGGTVIVGAGTTSSTAATTPVLTVVDKTGSEKPLNTVLTSDKGKVAVSVASDIKQLLLPAMTDVITKDNMLVVNKDDFSLQIPGQVLEQLKASVQADQLKNARISVVFNSLTAEDIAEEIDKATGKSANTTIASVGAAYDITLSLIAADGKETKLTQFNLPATLKLKVNEDSNKNLTGIYYLDDQGELQYIDDKLDNGFLITEISHFSKYAVLQYSKTFNDVPATHWATGAIQSLVAKQVVTGTSELMFSPDKNVTRAEFAAFIARKLKLNASSTGHFSDVATTKWYADEVAAAVEAGIVTGTSGSKFAPEVIISRQEMVVMLMKAYIYKNNQPLNVQEENHPFVDDASISEWAKPYARAAHQRGWILGRSGNKFAPLQNATRAEAVQLISKL